MQQDPSMSSPIRYDLGADRVVTIIFDAPDAPVNTMTEAWIRALHDTLDRLEAERDSYDGVIIASAKKTFFAGAELKEVLKFTPADGPRVFEWLEGVKRDLRRLEKLDFVDGQDRFPEYLKDSSDCTCTKPHCVRCKSVLRESAK